MLECVAVVLPTYTHCDMPQGTCNCEVPLTLTAGAPPFSAAPPLRRPVLGLSSRPAAGLEGLRPRLGGGDLHTGTTLLHVSSRHSVDLLLLLLLPQHASSLSAGLQSLVIVHCRLYSVTPTP